MEALKKFIPPLHKEGYYFVSIFAIATLVLGLISSKLGFVGTIATIWCFYFFRDPIRITPIHPDYVISPADGFVVDIRDAPLPKELDGDDNLYKRISIFLNVFDVHVNRIPINGTIEELIYHPGKFFNASLDKASEHNERQTVAMRTEHGKKIVFVQIAGLIARRIVCDLEKNQEVKAGTRFGIIKFGSRVDIYLPQEAGIKVLVGQRVIGAETIVADLSDNAETVEGEIR